MERDHNSVDDDMDLDQQPSNSILGGSGRARTSAATANNLFPTSVTATPIQPSSLSDKTQIKILAVEMVLLNKFFLQKFGVHVLNVNSVYFRALHLLHQPSQPELNKIKCSLDAELADTTNQKGDIGLDETLIVVKEEANCPEEDTLLVEPGEPDMDSDERADSVEGNATTPVNERRELDVATPTPDVSLPGRSKGALTMAASSTSVPERHVTQEIATRGKRSEKNRRTINVKAASQKKKTTTLPLPVSRSRVKQSQSSASWKRAAAVSRNGGREKKHKCSCCNKTFVSTSQTKRHELTHTGEKPFKCDVCQVSFKLLHHKTVHMRTHTREKPFKCNFCPKVFTTSGNKINHERCHTGEKPYACELCNASFSRIDSKKDHMQTHTREKPFQCDECGATFARKQHKLEHMRVHTGDKPFHCQYCDKQFSRSSDWSRHLRIHTNEMSYVCLVCAKAFNQSSTLRKHEKTHRK